MKKLDPCIFKGLWFFLLVATSKLWFPLLNDNRVVLLSSTIIVCIGYLIYDLIVNRPHIKENNQIRTKNIDRIAGNLGMVTAVAREGPQDGQRGCELWLRRRQAFGETVTMETLRKEDEEMGKFAEKMKEKQELSTTRKGINFPRTVEEVRVRDLARLQKAKEVIAKLEEAEKGTKLAVEIEIQLVKVLDELNKELVAKLSCVDHVERVNKELEAELEEVEKETKIAVETKIQLVKILDEVNKDSIGKISCFDLVQKVNKELVAKLEKVEKDKKIAVERRIELMKIVDEERKKVSCLDHAQKLNKELVAQLEKVEKDKKIAFESRIELMKILDEEREKVSCLEKKCVNLEEENVKNKLETHIPVDGNTNKCEDDIMFGSEDDTVFVDFDDFQAIENV